MDEHIPFKKLLKQLMDKNCMSQAELARQTGIHRTRISEYLKGKSRPRPENLQLLYTALNYEPENDDTLTK